MSQKYVLDTNLYINAIRHPAEGAALDVFLERNAPFIYMSAVVMQELRAGAITDASARALDRGIFRVFERRGRIVGPSVLAFKECGRILAALFRRDGIAFKERPRSLVNDLLIALTCRENGITLLTNDGDFKTIRHSMRGFVYLPPWPA
jgi:predicted nucleic acid-binding protein